MCDLILLLTVQYGLNPVWTTREFQERIELDFMPDSAYQGCVSDLIY